MRKKARNLLLADEIHSMKKSFIHSVLFIDDDPDDLEFYGECFLNVYPHIHVEEARNGLRAMEYLRQAKKNRQLPNLIVLDINMPLLGGRETLQEIKDDEELASIPVVIFSTASSPAEKAYFEQRGVQYFIKPSSLADMQRLAKQIGSLFALC